MIAVADEAAALLTHFGLRPESGGDLPVHSPIDGTLITTLATNDAAQSEACVAAASSAFDAWRRIPAPKRGELVRRLGDRLREEKQSLARLVTIECGKPLSEALGEVQEMIDICEFAVGLSRQLYGLTIASERPEHRMIESWHPLGVTAIISAFNFPVAVWAWNAALALVCGNSILWKPSEKTPLTALAVQRLLDSVIEDYGSDAPAGLSQVIVGGRDAGAALVDSRKVALVSATGSTAMGRDVGTKVAARFGRSLLELGGNNASIVAPSADQALALRACAFGFMGTTGQRCTSLRRLFVHSSIYDAFSGALARAAASISIGDPRDETNLIGPLIDEAAFTQMQSTLNDARSAGARVTGGERLARPGVYVRPAIIELPRHEGTALKECFAPLLHLFAYDALDEAIALQNSVSHGLSSSLFTTDLREAEQFLSAVGSDCGIANINIGTSGAEIGGAFGGEKETGGGRESGSDSWKAYMRRQTSTINYGATLPLAQGVSFDIG